MGVAAPVGGLGPRPTQNLGHEFNFSGQLTAVSKTSFTRKSG